MLEILIVRYELKGMVRTRPEIFRVVFGTCAQFCPYETSAKMRPKIYGGLNQKSSSFCIPII